jgi:hypothetical protein
MILMIQRADAKGNGRRNMITLRRSLPMLQTLVRLDGLQTWVSG